MEQLMLVSFILSGILLVLRGLDLAFFTDAATGLCLTGSVWLRYAALVVAILAAILTGVGIFDRVARYAGAGTLVPVTGFANAVVSPAIDTKSEGLILGVGAQIFTVAGPVLLYGTLSGVIWGLVYYLIGVFS